MTRLAHVFFVTMDCGVETGESLAKVVGNRHLNPEGCNGMKWAESAEG